MRCRNQRESRGATTETAAEKRNYIYAVCQGGQEKALAVGLTL